MTKRSVRVMTVVGLTLAVLVFFGVRAWQSSQQSRITVGTLSDRAQEFVQAQQKSSSSSWSTVVLESATPSAQSQSLALQETPCFSVNLPFSIRSVVTRTPEDCAVQVRVISPAAKLTISVLPLSGPLSDDSAVKMRTTFTDKYTRVPFETTLFPQSMTFSESDGISFFTVKDDKLVAIIFSETNDQERILIDSLPKLLEVLMVY